MELVKSFLSFYRRCLRNCGSISSNHLPDTRYVGVTDNYSLLFLILQFNFVGRILGPRGMTAKQLEQETGCKIMVRGRGSMRDKKKVSSQHCVSRTQAPGHLLIKYLLSYVEITSLSFLQDVYILVYQYIYI
jgi:hypothetical protein